MTVLVWLPVIGLLRDCVPASPAEKASLPNWAFAGAPRARAAAKEAPRAAIVIFENLFMQTSCYVFSIVVVRKKPGTRQVRPLEIVSRIYTRREGLSTKFFRPRPRRPSLLMGAAAPDQA